MSTSPSRDRVLVADPCAQPNPALVVGALRAGALGVLDLATVRGDGSADAVVEVVAEVTRRCPLPFAVRLAGPADGPRHFRGAGGGGRAEHSPDLPEQVDTVVVAGPHDAESLPAAVAAWSGRRVLVEVVSAAEAVAAVAAGADGLVAKGCEAGGRVGDVEAFVLAQQVARLDIPFWVHGGIGLRTAAAAVAGGAAGVLLDGQLALVRESTLDHDARAAIAAMDGSETRVLGGHRVYVRPDLPAAALPDDVEVGHVAERLGPDLHHDLLPVGQDAAVAAGLARRHVSVGGVVQAVRAAIDVGLAAAAEHRPLAPGAGVSSTNGTRYPVVQGPMTRVSDKAELAAAVAAEGGLPFLALALLPGAEVRDLLTRTAELLGDRPWGVGVLGFVPADVRAEQLEVVHEVRPPAALIAGGRPSQARPLEEAGITTYLHVPSPGLLDRFLRDGARRFVFEGRECGGHVGPRASFPLWDAQVERLLQLDDATLADVDVLFAGGIHDARSAAMVAAAGAPLAARGARLGVLMGTAYLFTDEAVDTGAITPTFQDVARSCEATVLLETSPGHATRCVETDYVRAFAARKAELEAAGTPAPEMWAELEALNLGRLRVASKGITRAGPVLVPVDATTQRRDGMYMIGQVATLRRDRTGIADLHEEVTAGATAHLADRADRAGLAGRLAATPRRAAPGGAVGAGDTSGAAGAGGDVGVGVGGVGGRSLDIAIVGMAGMFPGAADTERFWADIVAGVDRVTEVPRERWDAEAFYDPAATGPGAGRRTPSKWGGFLPWVPFDALAYGIPPRSLAAIESVQLLSLEAAARALADAGYDRRAFDRSRASVVFGTENGNDLGSAYGFRACYPHYVGPLPPELDAFLPAPTEDSFPGVLTNVIAGRIANRLDLGGVNYTVDAACAASLAALDAACKELLGGHSDLVLCGAADVHNGINDYLMFASVHALSPTGRCRTFDAAADGIALGEGVACLVLKRLADAERDGDRVYAVIEGVAGSSDGRHLGLTAPRQEGQARALTRAYEGAGVAPASVGLVEAHGTGTVVGDRTELATLTQVFGADGAAAGATVLGSVKSQIGHTKCAAGLAGLIKAARALHAGVLPPTCNLETPNDYWSPDDSPFRFLGRALPWPAPERRAGVSAFGFGGTNFHAVLRSHPDDERPRHGLAEWPAELFLVRAESDEARTDRLAELQRVAAAVAEADPGATTHRLRDLAWTVSAGGTGPVRAAVAATDFADLAAQLAAELAAPPAAGAEGSPAEGAGSPGDPVVAFLHPGQGSQRVGMLADLFVAFPHLQDVLRHGNERWATAMYPGAAFTPAAREAQAAALTDTRVAQPALGIAALALTRLLAALGVEPDMVGGHSYGELAALATAGVFDDDTLVDLSEARGAAMVAAAAALGDDAGAMAAVGLPADELIARLPADVVIANHNGPRQTVVAGPTAAVDALVAALAADKVGARRLDVAAAFHSPLVARAADVFAECLTEVDLARPQLPVWSNVTARPYGSDEAAIRSGLADQLGSPVRFVEQVEAMYEAGARVFVEVGPGRVLTRLVGRILGDRPHTAVACDVPGDHGVRRLLAALADLAVAGVPVDVRALFEGRAERVDITALPVAGPGWRMNGHLVCTNDGEPVAGGLQPADRIPEVVMNHGGPSQAPAGPAAAATSSARDDAVLEYLRSVQQIVGAQREVMLRYLGGLPAGAPAVDLEGELAGLAGLPELAAVTEAAAALHAAPAGANGNGASSSAPGPAGPGSNGVATDHLPVAPAPIAPVPAASVPPAPALPAPPTSPAAPAAPVGPPEQPEVPVAAPAPVERPRGDALLAVILAIVADRTGYPLEMLDPELDLEADLSIDSIKRIEIIGELAERVGLPGAAGADGLDEAVVEQLAQLKTLRAIVTFVDESAALAEQAPASPAPAPPPASAVGVVPVAAPPLAPSPAAAVGSGSGTGTTRPVAHVVVSRPAPGSAPGAAEPSGSVEGDLTPLPATRRFVLEPALLAPALPVAPAAGKTLVLVSDPWDGLDELRRLLERSGATVEVIATHRGAPARPLPEDVAARLALADGVVHLGAADAVAPVDARDVFATLRPAITGRATTLVAAVARRVRSAPATVSGVPGLMRSVARELPDHHVRSVEIDGDQRAQVVARLLADEVLDPAGPVTVAYREGKRTTRRLAKGADIGPDLPATPFDQDSVVVLTGGARGITAKAALAIARDSQCRIELLGRSPLPGDEDLRTAAALDRPALRRALLGIGELATPADIEAACDRIQADREIRATMAQLRALGSPTTYHSVDVRDADALTRVLADIREYHGRIDAVVHGAGVIDDHLARDKTDEGFDRVFATKVDAARTLVAHLGTDVRLVVFFGSVSGVFGNRGQVDYSAANDGLDELASRLDGLDGRRVISIDWGPWSGAGMMSPELEREYARRGVGMIHPDEGVRALLAELGTLPGEPCQVVIMRAEPATMEGRPPSAPGSWTPTGAELDESPEPGAAGPVGLAAPTRASAAPPAAPAAGAHDGAHPHPHDAGAAGGLTLEDLTERG